MKLFSFLLTLIFTSFSFWASAQSSISGTISDEDLGEGLISAYVFVENTEKAAATDFDGKYNIQIEPGTYTIKITYIGYADKVVTDVIVKDNETTYLDISMSSGTQEMEEVVVTAKVIERSENAVMMLQKKSFKIQDGISSQEMSKLSVGSVASAMKKITGATVQDGKYLNVRGLGDRYSLAQMDGIILPSVDPYKNSAQLDFIPTNIIDNIIASKSFTPDQPGTFTGGNVTIKTKSLPERETFSAGISFGYNTVSSLNGDFLRNTRQSTDWLGFDDGSRALNTDLLLDENQDGLQDVIPTLAQIGRNDEVEINDQLTKTLDFEFDAQRTTSPINSGINISYGNSYQLKNGHQLGLIMSGKYSRNFSHREDMIAANYSINGELRNFGDYRVDQSQETPSINGFAGLTYRFNSNNEIVLKNIYAHQTTISSRYVIGEDGQNIEAPSFKIGRDNTFQELGLNLTSLSGRHNLPKAGGLKIEWTGSYINSFRKEPELAYLSSQYNAETGLEGIPDANVAPPLLFWRDIQDHTATGKVDLTYPVPALWNMELKSGMYYTMMSRNSDETSINIATASNAPQFDGADINEFYSSENAGIIGVSDNDRYLVGNYAVNYTNDFNSYYGNNNILAGYAMASGKPSENFRFVTGLRVESTDIFAQSKIVQNLESVEADSTNTGSIKSVDFLPSISLIFNPNDDSNFRLGYSKTIARPSLREIAPFASWDPIISIFFLGNVNLTTTDIHNYDARWEWFMNPGELVALSVFYKDFRNPISLSVKPASNTEFQYINVASGNVSGIEIELRKNLGFLNEALNNFKFGGNLSLIRSQMDIPSDARFVPEKRTFTGQSPLLANANLTYSNPDVGIEGSLSYNYIGRRLASLGDQAPDTYAQPFNTLNFTLGYSFGKYNVKFAALNLINNNVTEALQYQGQEYITSEFTRGRTFNVGVSYRY